MSRLRVIGAGGVNYSSRWFPSIFLKDSATTMLANNVSLEELDAVLVGFRQADGAIIKAAMRTTHILL